MMKKQGTALGFGNYADAISRSSSGRYQVADPQLRNEIMNAAQGSDRQCGDGRRLHAAQRRRSSRSGSAASRPTASSTSRISSGPAAPAS